MSAPARFAAPPTALGLAQPGLVLRAPEPEAAAPPHVTSTNPMPGAPPAPAQVAAAAPGVVAVSDAEDDNGDKISKVRSGKAAAAFCGSRACALGGGLLAGVIVLALIIAYSLPAAAPPAPAPGSPAPASFDVSLYLTTAQPPSDFAFGTPGGDALTDIMETALVRDQGFPAECVVNISGAPAAVTGRRLQAAAAIEVSRRTRARKATRLHL